MLSYLSRVFSRRPEAPPSARPDAASLFLSSTFQDMQRERGALTRLVFPRLRSDLKARDVVLNEIDLRWGVTEAMTAGNSTLAICLDAIAYCWPLVLGIVGHRAGWMRPISEAERYDSKFFRQLSSGSYDNELSITELELQYAAYLQKLTQSPPIPVLIRSEGLSAEMGKFEDGEATRRFRNWVTNCDAIRCVPYDSWTDFETLVERELRQTLTAYLDNPAVRRSTVGRKPVTIDRSTEVAGLNKAARSGKPTLLYSPPGAGTTSICRTWLEDEPTALYVDGREADFEQLARHLSQPWSDVEPLSPSPVGVQSHTDPVIQRILGATKGSRLVLDHFEKGFPVPERADLATFPTELRNTALVVVTHDNRLLDQAQRLGWSSLTVGPVEAQTGCQFAVDYLRSFFKELTDAQKASLINAPWITDLSSLVLVVEELRRFGNYEGLDRRLQDLCRTATGADIVEEVLSGLRDVLSPWGQSADDALLALFISQKGLTEDELRKIVALSSRGPAAGSDDDKLPPQIWSVIWLSLRSAFARRGQLVDIGTGAALDWCNGQAQDGQKSSRVARAFSATLAQMPQEKRVVESVRLAVFSDPVSGVERLAADPSFALQMIAIGETYCEGILSGLSHGSRLHVLKSWIGALERGELERDEAWALGLQAQRLRANDDATTLLEFTGEDSAPGTTDIRIGRDVALAFLKRDKTAFERIKVMFEATAKDTEPEKWKALSLAVVAAGASGHLDLSKAEEEKVIGLVQSASEGSADWLYGVQVQLGIGQIMVVRAKWQKALAAFRKVEQLARRIGHARLLCRSLERISAVSIELHQFSAGLGAAEECLKLSQSVGLGETEALAFERLIEIERSRTNWRRAYELQTAYARRCNDGIADPQRAKRALAALEGK